jgi:hypothetical protein
MYYAFSGPALLTAILAVSNKRQYVVYNVCASTRDALYTGTAQPNPAFGHTPILLQPRKFNSLRQNSQHGLYGRLSFERSALVKIC